MSLYVSDLGGMPVIDDTNWQDYVSGTVDGEGMGRGYEPEGYAEQGFGANPYGEAFNLPLIPRSEWRDRIEEKERTKSGIKAMLKLAGIPVKNQQRTNYCWANGPVYMVEIWRAIQGLPYVSLSPASVAAVIKNFQNRGGWGSEAIRFLAEHGAAPSDLWPDAAIDRRYKTVESDRHRADYQADKWLELRPRNFDQLVTCLLSDMPVGIGLNWWRHYVTATGAVIVNDSRDIESAVGVEYDNSWGMNYGDEGRGVLAGTRKLADEQWSITSVTAS